jgi:hypothetical protein
LNLRLRLHHTLVIDTVAEALWHLVIDLYDAGYETGEILVRRSTEGSYLVQLEEHGQVAERSEFIIDRQRKPSRLESPPTGGTRGASEADRG